MSPLRREPQYFAGVATLAVFAALALAFGRVETVQTPGTRTDARPKPADQVRAIRAAGRLASLPMRFEENLGQTNPEVRFLSRGRGYTLFLTSDEAVLSLQGDAASGQGGDEPASATLRMRLAGSQEQTDLSGEQLQPGRSHYFRGKDPSQWRSGVPHYGRVRRHGVYPGIDLVYYGAKGSLEYDFVVSPGADPQQVELEFQGQRSLAIDGNGDLVLDIGGRPLRHEKPEIYQQYGDERVGVAGRYEQRGPDRVGFLLAANYDPTRPLIIDPVLNYSTFLGNTDDEQGVSIAVDSAGNAYITGTTQSSQFPTTAGSAQPRFGGPEDDVFITKLDPVGGRVIFSTFLGSNQNDRGRGVAVGSDGAVYVAGETGSTEFPTTAGAWQEEYGRGGRDAFVAKLSADGSTLVYSTFIGSDDQDWATDIAVDSQGQAHVIGGTESSSFPTTSLVVQPTFGGDTDAFIVKMRADGSGPLFSTFLGGGSYDEGLAITLDPFSTIFVTGYTTSNNFPVTANGFQRERDSAEEAFVVKMSGSGTMLNYSSYFGGNGSDFGNDITIDSAGNAYLTGFTRSNDLFRTPPVFQNENNGGGDAFIAKIVESPRLQVGFMTYLGSSGEDTANGIVVMNDGSVTITGHTKSQNFPVTADAIQPQIGGGDGDAFVATINPLFRQLLFSTFLGGESRDEARAITRDAAGNLFITGVTRSRDFPITGGSYQQAKSDGDEVFVLQISQTITVTSVSAASFDPAAPVAPNSIASAFGHDLAPDVAVAGLPLPAELLGVRVHVIDNSGFSRSAALFFVSPGQINFLVPDGTVAGSATVEVVRDGELIGRGSLNVQPVAPALFAINANGQGVAAAFVTVQRSNGSRSTQTVFNPNQFPPNIEPIPVDIGTQADQAVLQLFGTGIRGAGGVANVSVSINGIDQQVLYAGDQMEFAGLDQVNVLLSPSLAGSGLVSITLTAGELVANQVTIHVQ